QRRNAHDSSASTPSPTPRKCRRTPSRARASSGRSRDQSRAVAHCGDPSRRTFTCDQRRTRDREKFIDNAGLPRVRRTLTASLQRGGTRARTRDGREMSEATSAARGRGEQRATVVLLCRDPKAPRIVDALQVLRELAETTVASGDEAADVVAHVDADVV